MARMDDSLAEIEVEVFDKAVFERQLMLKIVP
jgi:hypothetical protein